MATTYTRIKNRRGLRADLPQPLADGEIGLATDTREVYIGAGTQDLLNSDVQVTPFLDAQAVVSGDLTNIDSATTNNGLLFFNVTGTQTFTGDGTNKNSYTISSANVSIPSGKSPIGSSYESQDFVITKYINGNPTVLDTSKYSIVNSGGNYQINFITAPEAGSKVCVVKWTEAQTREHARARASWEASNSAVSSYNKWQANDLANNQVWVDITTGTGMVQFVTAGEKTALSTANANDSISTINEPATYSFLGENTTLGHVARNIAIDSNLKIDLDTPQQAYNVSRFINKKRGQVSRVANNIQIYTEASYPQFQTNQYVSFMRKARLEISQTNKLILSYPLTECNVYNINYSLSYEDNKSITGATQANPVVITASNHGFSNGDLVTIKNVSGMTELNVNTKFIVANKTANTFELTGIDGTGYSAWTSGGLVNNLKYRHGTILIATGGNEHDTNTTINDNFVETGDTSAVSFAAAISSGQLEWQYTNTDNTNVANLSYKIERWLQS